MSGWEGESNGDTYGRYGKGSAGKDVHCGLVKGVNLGSLRWFRHMTRMKEDNFLRRVCDRKIEVWRFRRLLVK